MELWTTLRKIFVAEAPKAPKPKGLQIGDYLTEKSVVFLASGPSKQQVIGHLISVLDLPDPNAALQSILAREEAGSTVVAPGLALPHSRVPNLKRLQAAIGISPEGIIDSQSESGPVHVYVLFIGPADHMKEHLAFLARVSVLFQKEGFTDHLVRSGSPTKALEYLRKVESNL